MFSRIIIIIFYEWTLEPEAKDSLGRDVEIDLQKRFDWNVN